MILKSNSEIVRLVSSSIADLDVQTNFATHDTTTFVPSSQNVKINTASTTTIVAAPTSGQRQIKNISIQNTHATLSNTLDIEIFDGTSSFKCYRCSIAPKESIYYDGITWKKYASGGLPIDTLPLFTEALGDVRSIYKIGSATEAAGVFYCFSKDSGFPGAISIGTPGLAGRVLNGTTEAGVLNFGNPASGSWYLRDISVASSVAGFLQYLDFLWINTGLVVTTITAQTINSITLPSRDQNGTTEGKGIEVGILVTTATTNAGAVANITMSYTNSSGVVGRTATMNSFPATAVVGTFMKFQLQAGDNGVRSIQNITIGTTLTAGAISLVMYRTVNSANCILANAGSLSYPKVTDIKLPNEHALIPIIQTGGTTAVTLNASVYAVNK